jgi:hypothetical protein
MTLPSRPTPASSPTPAATPPIAEPTHACIRCGRPGVAVDKALCEQCNPLELAQPSATQVHGIAVLGIIVFVAILAVAGRAVLAGTGPFTGTVLDVESAPGGLSVTLSVHNAGTKAGATTCQIVPDSRPVGATGDLVQSPTVPAGGEIEFSATITRLGTVPIGLVANCQSP